MENILVLNSNSCCNAVIKVNCWYILAKYKSSKLDVVKKATEDAALDEFETRLFLRNYYTNSVQNNRFLEFTQKVYNRAMMLITDYICSPDWSIFYDEGNSSIWQLKTVIQNELIIASSAFHSESHPSCCFLFYRMREQIISLMESWTSVIYIYSNYISASLSEIFNDKMKKIICKYENYPHNNNFRWLCDDIMSKCGHNRWDHLQPDDEKSQFWFINETINLHFFEEPFVPYSYNLQSEDELMLNLSYWLFRESTNQLQMNTRLLVQFNEHHVSSDEMKVLHKEQLASFLNVPMVNLELYMAMATGNEMMVNFNISEAPHYFIPDASITELQPAPKRAVDSLQANADRMSKIGAGDVKSNVDDEKTSFDFDSILNKPENEDTMFNCKLSGIKEELEDYCANDKELVKEEPRRCEENVVSLPRLQIKARHEVQKADKAHDMYPAVQHKKRGRPKKIDDYSQNPSKNGQHKYSPEDVQDCSIWISDNFYEVAGNKPAIDRARMYELYTNYCLLKLCTPVDRALFGKIIRKVFPKLKSRRLIQNQVLKYHYVGLKPKYPELEQALLYSDSSSLNPSEILVTYAPVEE